MATLHVYRQDIKQETLLLNSAFRRCTDTRSQSLFRIRSSSPLLFQVVPLPPWNMDRMLSTHTFRSPKISASWTFPRSLQLSFDPMRLLSCPSLHLQRRARRNRHNSEHTMYVLDDRCSFTRGDICALTPLKHFSIYVYMPWSLESNVSTSPISMPRSSCNTISDSSIRSTTMKKSYPWIIYCTCWCTKTVLLTSCC